MTWILSTMRRFLGTQATLRLTELQALEMLLKQPILEKFCRQRLPQVKQHQAFLMQTLGTRDIVHMVRHNAEAPGTVTADAVVPMPIVSANPQGWSTRHFSSGFEAHRPTWRQRQWRCRLFVSDWRRRRL